MKHELFIRNALVNKYNSICKPNELAVAEYPKIKGAVDLSLLKNNTILHKVEFKYQYPKDLADPNVLNSLLKDTNDPKGTGHCTDFILIIHERSEAIKNYSNSGVKPIYTNLNDKFTENYPNLLLFEKNIKREFGKEVISIKCSEPYISIYHFVFYQF